EPEAVVVTQMQARVREDELAGYERDTLALTATARRWGRRRVTTSAGRALALALPTGSVRRAGGVLPRGPRRYAACRAAPAAGRRCPAAGFAHRFGLEPYVRDGRVRDREGLEAFIAAHLEGSAGPADAAVAAIAARLARDGDADGWIALDARLDAMKSVPELRAASRQMGRQTLRIAAGLGADPFLARLVRAVDGSLA